MSGSDWVAKSLTSLLDYVGLPASIKGCAHPQVSWEVPFPVVALEASLVFAFLRLSASRLKIDRLPAALAAAGLSSVLMVTLATILDPVVSTTQWCGWPDQNPGYYGLCNVQLLHVCKVDLWHWFTNETVTGYWFGVPVVNYLAWFVGMGAFSFLARLDEGPHRGLMRKYDRWFKYVFASIAMLAVLFAIELVLTIGLDLILVRAQPLLFDPHPVFKQRVWELGVVVLLVLLGVRLIWRFGTIHPTHPFERIAIVPPFLVLGLCLVALLREPRAVLFVVWVLAVAAALVVVFLRSIDRFIEWLLRPAAENDVHAG